MKLSDQITRRQLFVAFGTSQQTGSLSSVDLAATSDASAVTLSASDGSVAPVAGADASKAGVMTAADKVRLDGLPPTTVRDFDSSSEVPGAAVAGAITHLRTAGHASGADGGGGLYRRVLAEPAHAGKVQSADGAWWELVPDTVGVSVHQFGVKGDDATDDTAAIQAAIDYALPRHLAVWLHGGRVYRVSNLVVNKEVGFVLRSTVSSSSSDFAGAEGARLDFHGTAGTTLLHLQGVIRGIIEGVTFHYGSAAPDAYIKTDKEVGFAATTIRLHDVVIFGNGRADGSVGFDMGPNSDTNDSDHDWGRVEFRSIQTGWRFNHSQCVGYHVNYMRGVSCGTLIDVLDGGDLKVSTLNCTNNDLDIRIRGSGAASGQFVFDNAHVEQNGANADAVFLDVASTGSGGIAVVLNGLAIQDNYTGTHIKVGQAATVIMNGGVIRAGGIDLSGTKDEGDAWLIARGLIAEPVITANDWGFYDLEAGMHFESNGENMWGGDIARNGARVLGFRKQKMRAAPPQVAKVPLTHAGSSSVKLTLPTTAIVTAIKIVVTDNTSVSGSNDKWRVVVGGTELIEMALWEATPQVREMRWAANDLLANDVEHGILGQISRSAWASAPDVISLYDSGDIAQGQGVVGYMLVEYADENNEPLNGLLS